MLDKGGDGTTPIQQDVRDKMRRRAARAFAALDAGEVVMRHRITDVGAKSLRYRLRRGVSLTIKRDIKGRIYVPARIEQG